MFTWKSLFDVAEIILHDLFKNQQFALDNSKHIKEAARWLCNAQDSTNDGGVSEGYHLYHGWLPSYPETTGYVIETFFDYFNLTDDESIKKRAVKMADWLVAIQNDDGSIPDSYFKKKMVFDTGQVIFGFVRAFKEMNEIKYKESAIKAGDWLLKAQEEDGNWKKFAVDGIPHTYYSRVAWSLAQLHSITNEDKYIIACKKNIEWAIQQQEGNGWFNKASFNLKNHIRPFTHTIAYTIRGILEAGLYFDEERYIGAAIKAADSLVDNISEDGFIPGTYDNLWNGDYNFSCLTGNAQLAIIFLKIFMKTRNKKYYTAGEKINRYLKLKQELRIRNKNIHGAIAGSHPIWGKYIHFTYPNWAAKFFIDSLILEDKVQRLI